MRKNNSTSQAAPFRTKLEPWRNDETRAEYMARSGTESIIEQVPFLVGCMILAAWVVWVSIEVAVS